MLALSMSAYISPTVSAVSPNDWRAGRIIDDTVFMNKNSMSVSQIQQFLESKMPTCDTYGDVGGGYRKTYATNNPPPFTCLRDYKEVPKSMPGNWIPDSNYGRVDGTAPAGSKSAAELIWDAAQSYNINPKVLLVTLQKESGLVTDDWPLKRQLVYAMGANCPDSGPGGSANCDINYSGFSMQMRESAKLLRYYLDNMDQPWWDNKRPYQSNNIQYDVEIGCGSSSVYMESRATTALYVYTPYQPTQEALNAGYGSAEPCGAYGNRNFWLYYNDWFGSSLDRSFILAKSSTSSAQYVIYNGLKQLIPSTEIKVAWGLENTPLETVDQAYIDSLTVGPNLDIVFRINSGVDLFMADSGKRYKILSPDMLKTWKLDGKAISNVPTGLGITPTDAGTLSFSVRKSGTQAMYMLDGLNSLSQTNLRQYQSPDVLYAIEGNSVSITTVSSNLFSTIDDSILPMLQATKVAYNSKEYQLLSGQRLFQSNNIAPLYPGVAEVISDITFQRLVPSSDATPFVRSNNSPDVYMVDAGIRYHVQDPELLTEWLGTSFNVNIVNQGYISLISKSNLPLTSNIAVKGSEAYVLAGGKKLLIPFELRTAYTSSVYFSSSVALMNAYPSGIEVVSRFVRNASTKSMSLLDNSGNLRYLSSPVIAELWGVNTAYVINLPPKTIENFSSAEILSTYVTDGTDFYTILNGKRSKLTSNQAKAYNMGTAQSITDGTIESLPLAMDFSLSSQDSGKFYKVIGDSLFMTTDPSIGKLWNVGESSADYSKIVASNRPALSMLSPFFNHNGTNYVVDVNKIYSLTTKDLKNFSTAIPIVTSINPGDTGMGVSPWLSSIFKTNNNKWHVIDKGTLRNFNHPVILNHWTNDQNLFVNITSESFSKLFKIGINIERAIKTQNSPKIYSAENGSKRWITDPNTFNNLFAPFTNVSTELLETLSDGPDI